MNRRSAIHSLCALGLLSQLFAAARAQTDADPFGSMQWPELRREFLGPGEVVFDRRVQVQGPAFAEDPMNVPISVSADGIADIDRITVLVDRNPIRKVLEFFPLTSLPHVSFRFKLEQASPVRVAVRTRDGVWHVGGVWVDSQAKADQKPKVIKQFSADYFDLLKRTGAFPGRPWGEATAAWTKHVPKWTVADAEAGLRHVLRCDERLKDTRASSEEQVLTTLVLELCTTSEQRRG